jgi:hypothetical protein
MKKDSKTKDFTGSVSVVFPTEEKTREFIENSKQIPIKYDDQSILECSLQNDYSKDKKQEDLPKKSNETLVGALIHLAGKNRN